MAALTHPPHAAAAASASAAAGFISCKNKGSFAAASGRFLVRASANFNQYNKRQQQQHILKQDASRDHVPTSPPPYYKKTPSFGLAEEMASVLGREMAVANLERLFRQQATAGGHRPPDDGGSSRCPARVAYQGSRGSYCQEAAVAAFPSPAFKAFPCDHMEDAFAVLEDRSADRAVVPAENSLDGPIDRNLDLLLRHPGVRILGELVLPVNHCLLSHPGPPRSGLRRVVSHPQALSHCRRSLEALDLEVDEVCCAAEAARYVAENRVADTAVIGSRMAAREFGLRVLEDNFQDQHLSGNFNRFLQLGLPGHAQGLSFSSSSSSSGGGGRIEYKTTVAFSLEGGASDLFRAMWVFESRGVRVSRVDHRPNRAKPLRVVDKTGDRLGKVAYLDYVFVLDVEGSATDAGVEAALARLKELATFARVLGSYACTCHTR